MAHDNEPRQAAPSDPFLRFAQTAEAVGLTAGRLEKLRILGEYLSGLSEDDLPLACRFLSGSPFPSSDDRTLNEFGGYTYTQLNRPIGSRANPMADFNFDAASAGWRPTEHSDFKDRDYVFVYDWYKRFLASPLSPDGPTAIAIGME